MSDQRILFRPGTYDSNIWRAIIENDEYGLGDLRFNSDDVILDIGAHIGAFTYLALDRGAGMVVAVEPDTDNANFWRHNLHSACRAEGRSILITAAAWRSDRRGEQVRYAAVGVNTGGGNTLGEAGHPVAGVPFDALVDLACQLSPGGRIRLLKIDCEAAEWPILLTSRGLQFVDAVVGEYHVVDDLSQWPSLAPWKGRGDEATLSVLLDTENFRHQIAPPRNGLGLFKAWRPGFELPEVRSV